MAHEDLVLPEGFSLGLSSNGPVTSPLLYDARGNITCPEPFFFFFQGQQLQENVNNYQVNRCHPTDPTAIMSAPEMSSTTSQDWPEHASSTAATHPSATTPPSPPKRGRGRPRKTDTAPRPKKKTKTNVADPLPSLATSQTSPRELPSPDKPSSPTDPPGDRTDRRRDRNREAAQKCRTRKQRSTRKLVEDVAAAETINESLRREAGSLREETLLLKNMVLAHGDCDCPYVRAYIKSAASRLFMDDGSRGAPLPSPDARSICAQGSMLQGRLEEASPFG